MTFSLKHLASGVLALLCAASAQATYTISLSQVGSDVVMSGSGQIDTTGMAPAANNNNCSSRFDPPGKTLCLGTGNYGLKVTNGIAGAGVPTAMGTNQVFGTSSSGAPIVMSTNDLYLPAGYVSNSAISNSVTFSGQTLGGMGAVVGTYTMTLTSGDTIVVKIGTSPAATAASVPTMTATGYLALGLLMAFGGYVTLQRRRG